MFSPGTESSDCTHTGVITSHFLGDWFLIQCTSSSADLVLSVSTGFIAPQMEREVLSADDLSGLSSEKHNPVLTEM